MDLGNGMKSEKVVIDYTNYRGERGLREIIPLELSFKETRYHPGEQWILRCLDVSKNEQRELAMKDIHCWGIGQTCWEVFKKNRSGEFEKQAGMYFSIESAKNAAYSGAKGTWSNSVWQVVNNQTQETWGVEYRGHGKTRWTKVQDAKF